MEITHKLGHLSINKSTQDNVGFSLSNKKGSYCAFYNRPSSKYQGLFYFDTKLMTMYKFIENIEIEDGNEVTELNNCLYYVEREKTNLTESFLMPSGSNSLLYELDSPWRINLFLDFRDIYDNREWGRNYEIIRQKDCVIVKFSKKTDKREDQSDGVEEFTLYLAIKSDYDYYELNDKWVERFYSSDADRKMSQSKRFVYNALSLHGSRFVFSMSKDLNEAVKECIYSFNNFEKLRKDEETYLSRVLHESKASHVLHRQDISSDIKAAYINVVNSLNNLIVHDEFRPGVIAGYPWFFQYWSRDSLVSLKSIYRINQVIAGKMLYDYLNSINGEGRLSNLIGKDVSNGSASADAHGWLFVRSKDIVHEIEKYKMMMHSMKKIANSVRDKHDHSEIHENVHRHLDEADLIMSQQYDHWHNISYEVESSLERSLSRLHKLKTQDQLEFNSPKETWMDTQFDNDDRSGFRIEIQAFRLNMYHLLFELTRNSTYSGLEGVARSKVRSVFWKSNLLADGMNDFTQRPNIFLAAYAYSNLLLKEEWETCFSNNLSKTYLDWGGISTIDKSHHLFMDTDMGEDVRSYHRGDSWFWINNLAALVLHKTNKEKFRSNILQILSASTNEILWHGCIGAHCEISDAKSLSSKGCFNQAWSNAMYMEMIDEIFGL